MRDIKNGSAAVRYTVAYFDNEDDLVECVVDVRRRGLEIYDVFTPFPVHGLDLAVGQRPTRLTWVIFLGGLIGLLTAVSFQMYTIDFDWNLNVGGKPFAAYPLFVPVSFELTVLFSGLTAVGSFFVARGLWPFSRKKTLPRVTDDRFALVIRQKDAAFDNSETVRLLKSFDPVEVVEGGNDLV